MSLFNRKKRPSHAHLLDSLNSLPTRAEETHTKLTKEILANVELMRNAFKNCADAAYRPISKNGKIDMMVIYLDGLIDMSIMDESVLKPLLSQQSMQGAKTPSNLSALMEDHVIPITRIARANSVESITNGIINGKAALLLDGYDEALVLEVKGYAARAVEEPVAEPVIRGPREGFTESIGINTSLLRRKLKNPKLKFERMILGEVTQTDILVTYIEGLVNEKILEEVRNRLARISTDSIIESGYLEEFIEDSPFSPFPQIQNTERPDVVVANLLEGKVAILTDGTPFALVVPFTIWGAIQAAEDYYERYMYTTLIRWLRMIFLGVSLFLPSLYVALTTFHPQLLPTNLALTFATAREPSPFPAVVEALLMEVVFEVLREAGIRLPKAVGSAVSIVGALVIGQSAVTAGIVSAPMVIVVATTGIASFAIPRYNFATAIRMLRFPMLILAGALGFFGITVGALVILIHLTSLRSFGVPYLSGVGPTIPANFGDVLYRTPRWNLRRRPKLMSNDANPVRTPSGQKPSAKRQGRRR